jgi:hypothetical protein
MAQSSDELIKREIVDFFVKQDGLPDLRIFPQSSKDDQQLFSRGGLTFGVAGTMYGSCDAAWLTQAKWQDLYDGSVYDLRPIVALEGTDALNRGSSGNAQYQRFHHALGAVRNGVVGIYYFRSGIDKIQPDLFGMAVSASKLEKTPYLITDDLNEVKKIVKSASSGNSDGYLDDQVTKMELKFKDSFKKRYSSNWEEFAHDRSTVIKDDTVIKYAGRNIRNFTESSQRAGHIAVGEMYLTKYFFPDKKINYLFPRMTNVDLTYLDGNKSTDKEWFLLRNEPNVEIRTLDELMGLDKNLREAFIAVRLEPLKGDALTTYQNAVMKLRKLLEEGKVFLRESVN